MIAVWTECQSAVGLVTRTTDLAATAAADEHCWEIGMIEA